MKYLDLIFFMAFLCSLCALTLTHYALSQGAVEIAPGTKIMIYDLALGLNYIFAIKWTLLFFVYYVLRDGKLIKSKTDNVVASMLPFALLSFSFFDMWHDVLVVVFV